MSNQTKKLLFDIATACDEIASFIAGKTRMITCVICNYGVRSSAT
jgi:hypothetical protein